MASYTGPKVFTENLVLYLDAGNTKSYPGTGTSWRTLAGNVSASMFGTVPFETDVSPCFNFATVGGTFSYSATMGFTFGSNMIPTTGDFTLVSWVKNMPSMNQIGMFSNTGNADGYRYGPALTGVYYLIGPTFQEGSVGFKSTCLASQWYNIVTIFQRTSAKIVTYRNGEYQGHVGIPASQTAFTQYTPGIVRSGCCTLYTGKLAVMAAYSGALSEAQILDIFDLTKGRFGY